MQIDIPGVRSFVIEEIVFDLNGTLAVDGVINEAILSRFHDLASRYRCHIITAGTHGNIQEIAAATGIDIQLIEAGREAEQKRMFVAGIGALRTAAIGNGANDRAMLEEAGLAIAVCGPEGLCLELIRAADILVASQEDALDLLLNPSRIIATLRQ